MTNMDTKTKFIADIVNWAYTQENVRAILSIESNAENDFDPFFYDLIIVAMDSYLFSQAGWIDQATKQFVKLETITTRNPYAELAMRAIFEDGIRLKYQVWEARTILKPLLPPELDDGFTVLLDKDNLVDKLPPSNYKMYIPPVPSEQEYHRLIETFFIEATNIARYLQNKDLLPAKHYFYKIVVHDLLSTMLEWHIEIRNDWSIELNSSRIGFEKLLGIQLWSEYKLLYVGPGSEESWAALSQSIDLFRKVAIEIGEIIGFSYPFDLDKQNLDYLSKIIPEQR